MSEAGASLEQRLRDLLQEAREAGQLEQLRAIFQTALEAGVEGADKDARAVPARFGMVGASPAMGKLFDLLERVVASDGRISAKRLLPL